MKTYCPGTHDHQHRWAQRDTHQVCLTCRTKRSIP